jgi:hypothetical protein
MPDIVVFIKIFLLLYSASNDLLKQGFLVVQLKPSWHVNLCRNWPWLCSASYKHNAVISYSRLTTELGGFLYTRAIKNKQSSETGRTQDTEQGQSRINNPARQAGHKTQNKEAGWTHVFLLHYWHPLCYSCYKSACMNDERTGMWSFVIHILCRSWNIRSDDDSITTRIPC